MVATKYTSTTTSLRYLGEHRRSGWRAGRGARARAWLEGPGAAACGAPESEVRVGRALGLREGAQEHAREEQPGVARAFDAPCDPRMRAAKGACGRGAART